MKRILVITGIIILGIGIGAYILSTKLDLVISTIKPTLVAQIKEKTGISLDFESLALKGLLSPVLTIKNFSADNPQMSIKGKELSSSLELRPLLQGILQIRSIDISSAKVDLKDTPKKIEPIKPKDDPKPSLPENISETKKTNEIKIDIESLNAKDISIFKDSNKIENLEIKSNVKIEQENVTLSKLKGAALINSEHKLFFNSSSLVYTDHKISTPSLEVKSDSGTVKLIGDLAFEGISNLAISSDSLKLEPLAKLVGLNTTGEISLNGVLEEVFTSGSIEVFLNNVAISHDLAQVSNANGKIKANLNDKIANIDLVDTKLALNSVPVSINGSGSLIDFKTPNIKKLDIHLAGGNVSITGDQTALTLNGRNLQIPTLLSLAKTTVPIKGELTQVSLNKFKIMHDNFAGTGSIFASSLSIPGFNLFGEVMGDLKDVPILKEVLYSNLPAKYHSALSEDSTEIKSLSTDLTGSGTAIKFSNIKSESTFFSVIGEGTLTPSKKDGDISLTMILPKDLSEYLVSKLKGGSGFLNSSGNLELAVFVTIRGGKSSVKVKTDKLLKGAAKEAALQALDKALSGKKGEKIRDFLGGLGF